MKLALIQSDTIWHDPPSNFERLAPRIAAAANSGADLIVLPEMFACGFSMQTSEVAERPGGAGERFLVEQAARHRVQLAGSLPELTEDDPRPFNTLVLAGPDGERSRYRKIHPFSFAGEDRHYAAGREGLTVSICGVRVSFAICYDLRFADLFWHLADRTDLFVVPANWPASRREHWLTLLRARAIENQAYVAGVNRVGSGGGLDYSGDSCVFDPLGEELARLQAEEGIALAEIDAARVSDWRRKFPTFQDRRR